MLETDRPHVLREMIYVCRPAGVALGARRLRRAHRQDPVRRAHEQGPDHPHRPDPRQPLDRRPPAAHRGRPDRPVLRHHAPRRPRGRAGACTRRSATRRTAASRSCSSHEEARHGSTDIRISTGETATGALALAQGLGWFSIGLGVAELIAPGHLARFLGMDDHADLIRAYGAREIVTGVGILSQENPTLWIWGRVGGDVLDLETLARGIGSDNPQRANVRRGGRGSGHRDGAGSDLRLGARQG